MSSAFDDDLERACLHKLSDILSSGRAPGSRLSNNGPAEVVDHLYVGSALDAVDRRLLNRLRITHVLNCTSAEIIGDYGDVGYPPTPMTTFTANHSLPVVGSSASTQDSEFDDRGRHAGRDHVTKRSVSCRRLEIASGGSTCNSGNGYHHVIGTPSSGIWPNYSSLSRHRSVSRDLVMDRTSSSSSFSEFRNNLYSGYSTGSRTVPADGLHMTSSSSKYRPSSCRYGTSTRSSPCKPEYYYKVDKLAETGNSVRDVISDVIAVKRGENGSPYDPTRSTVRSYLEIHADDTLGYPLLRLHYAPVRRFLDSALSSGGRALIHCELGINRSVTLAVAYLIDTEGVALTQAVRQLRLARPNMLRNEGFRRQLVQFAAERKLVDATLQRGSRRDF